MMESWIVEDFDVAGPPLERKTPSARLRRRLHWLERPPLRESRGLLHGLFASCSRSGLRSLTSPLPPSPLPLPTSLPLKNLGYKIFLSSLVQHCSVTLRLSNFESLLNEFSPLLPLALWIFNGHPFPRSRSTMTASPSLVGVFYLRPGL